MNKKIIFFEIMLILLGLLISTNINAQINNEKELKKEISLYRFNTLSDIYQLKLYLDQYEEIITINDHPDIIFNCCLNGDSLDQYNTVTEGAGLGILDYAQGFVPRLKTLTKVQLYLFKNGNPTGDIKVSIRKSLNGVDLVSKTMSVSRIDIGWYTFNFNDIDITPGSKHYIIFSHSSGSSYENNAIYWLCSFYNPYYGGYGWILYESEWMRLYLPGEMDIDFCFKTYGDSPPEPPEIEGPNNVKWNTQTNFKFSVNEPENEDVYLYIDWGDDSIDEWIGPFEPNEDISIYHSWKWVDRGEIAIRAKAKDTDGYETDWATLEISISKNKSFDFIPKILLCLSEKFHFLQPYLTNKQ
jgi:hypothetical protein